MSTVGSLCTGAGGLDLAVAEVLTDVRTAWVSEVDPDASRVLEHRLPGVPNLGDLTTVDWSAVEPVDVLVAGFPCQPFSLAGKRKGTDDERWIWGSIADAVRHLRPRLVLLENVPGVLAHRGMGRVLGDLAGIGYDADWTCLRASDVGAPHQRNRVFIAARPATDAGRKHLRVKPVIIAARGGAPLVGDHREGTLMPTPDASRADRGGRLLSPDAAARRADGRGTEKRAFGLDDAVALLPTPTAMHTARNATANRSAPKPTTNQTGWTLADIAYADRWAQYGPAVARWETILGRPAPDPTVAGKRGGRRLSARFVEWLMGWPDGWVTDLVDNTPALRICGNGVVPQCAAAAYRSLLPTALREDATHV